MTDLTPNPDLVLVSRADLALLIQTSLTPIHTDLGDWSDQAEWDEAVAAENRLIDTAGLRTVLAGGGA